MQTKDEQELVHRCSLANIEFEELLDEFEYEGVTHGQYHGWFLHSTDDAGSSRAHLRYDEEIAFALATQFEHYRVLGKYEGVWSQRNRVAEAEVKFRRHFGRHGPLASVGRKLNVISQPLTKDDTLPLDFSIPLPTKRRDMQVELCFGSSELLVWRTGSPSIHLFSADARIPVLRIHAPSIPNTAAAVELVETFGSAALMQLDSSIDEPARLSVPYPLSFRLRGANSTKQLAELTHAPPTAPTQLYLHARLSSDDPVGTFLSFYHVLEFFFPRFSYEAESVLVKRRLQGSRLQRLDEADIRAVLEQTSLTKAKRGIGSEREQLAATIERIVSAEELRDLIARHEQLLAFYTATNPPLTSERVRVEISTRDLRQDVAVRLYAIRCRIVHKKESSHEQVLLPFSPEVASLHEDLVLLELLTRKALEATSQELP